MSDFDKWKQSLQSHQRREVEKWYREEINGPAVGEARAKIKLVLSQHLRHDRIVGKIAILFIKNENIANKTNCEFITYDPLYELGRANADILLFERNKKIAIIIEVKTGDDKPIKDLKDSKKVIDDNSKYLEEIVNSKVKEIIYMLVVTDLVRVTELKNDCNANGFALGYVEKDEFKLHSGSLTNLKELDSLLSKGIPFLTGNSIDIMLGSHPYHIISNTLLEIIQEKLINAKTSSEDKKIKEFTVKEFRETFQQLASISSVKKGSEYDKCINGKIEHLIQKGLDSGLIIETENKNTYNVYSQASVSIKKILKTLETKYINYYVEYNKEKIAEANVKSKSDQKNWPDQKTMEEYTQ